MSEELSAHQKLDLAYLRILTTNALRLFGCLLYNFETVFIKTDDVFTPTTTEKEKEAFKQIATANANIIKGKPTVTYYSSFIDECDVEELTFVILHEIIHVLDKHITPATMYTLLYLHNLACDHIINTNLKVDVNAGILKKVKVPQSAFIIKEIEGNSKYSTIKEVYNWLLENVTQNGGITVFNNGLGMYKLNIDGREVTIVEDIAQSSGDEVKENIEVAEGLQAEAKSIMDTIGDLMKGDSAGSAINELLKKIIEIEIPWTNLLDKSICHKMVPDDTNLSWKGLQKRQYALGLCYPVKDEMEIPSELIILEDQSGSVSKENIKKFASVLLQSIRYFEIVRIMRHDVAIHHDRTYESSQTNIENLLFEAGGRGGTSHKQVFEKIQKSFESGNNISLIVMLTDYESDIETLWPKYEWTKHIPVTIVCCEPRSKIASYVDKKPIYIK